MSNQGYGGPQDPNEPQDPYGQQNPYGQQDPNQQSQQPWQQQQPQEQPSQQQPYQSGGYQPAPPVGPGQQPYGQNAFKPVGDPGTLDLPWYGIGFGPAIKRAFQKYVRFDGRASRGEFWWFVLFNYIVGIVLSIPGDIQSAAQSAAAASGSTQITFIHPLSFIAYAWSLATLLPTIGLYWRRLHDTNRSGAWFFWFFACGIGGLVPFIMCIMDTNPEGRRFDRVQNAGGAAPGGYAPGGPGY